LATLLEIYGVSHTLLSISEQNLINNKIKFS